MPNVNYAICHKATGVIRRLELSLEKEGNPPPNTAADEVAVEVPPDLDLSNDDETKRGEYGRWKLDALGNKVKATEDEIDDAWTQQPRATTVPLLEALDAALDSPQVHQDVKNVFAELRALYGPVVRRPDGVVKRVNRVPKG
jgi:hypothetical protein